MFPQNVHERIPSDQHWMMLAVDVEDVPAVLGDARPARVPDVAQDTTNGSVCHD